MHLFSKISGGACPRTPLANSASGASWPCRMQELAWSGLSTPCFPFLGMPVHYMEQNLTCLLLLWLVFKSLMVRISSQTTPPQELGWVGACHVIRTVHICSAPQRLLFGVPQGLILGAQQFTVYSVPSGEGSYMGLRVAFLC